MTNYMMPNTSDDAAGNLAVFLTLNEGSCLAYWAGRMAARDQRRLFGRFLGKGKLHIDGTEETVSHTVKVCFGQDSHETDCVSWRDLATL